MVLCYNAANVQVLNPDQWTSVFINFGRFGRHKHFTKQTCCFTNAPFPCTDFLTHSLKSLNENALDSCRLTKCESQAMLSCIVRRSVNMLVRFSLDYIIVSTHSVLFAGPAVRLHPFCIVIPLLHSICCRDQLLGWDAIKDYTNIL